MSTKQNTITVYPSNYDSTKYSYASVVSGYPLTNPIGKGSANTSMCRVNLKTGSSAESYLFYTFDLSEIPQNATIDSVSCKAKVYINQTNSSRINTRQVQMYYGTNTAKGSSKTMSTSTTALTLYCGAWSRAELDDCRIRLYAKRGTSNTSTTYYMGMYGADLTVTYTYEDVQYVITTNCSGGAIDPSNPSVSNGANQVFVISSDSKRSELTSLTLDGVNVLAQAVRKESGSGSYTVNTVNGAGYGFEESGGYYVSQNKGKSSTSAVCRVNFNLPVECTVNFYVINYAEATYDYGMLGNIDQNLSTSSSADSSTYWKGNTSGTNLNSEQKVSYIISSGDHWVDVKYIKDSYTDSNNDTLQFRVEIIPNEEIRDGEFYYEYVLENVASEHTLVAVFGSAPISSYIYIKNNGNWEKISKVYKKINGNWVEQTDLKTVFDISANYVKGN